MRDFLDLTIGLAFGAAMLGVAVSFLFSTFPVQ